MTVVRALLAKLRQQTPSVELFTQVYTSHLGELFSSNHGSFTSCGHKVHIKCMEQLGQSQGNSTMRDQRTFFCPVCRRLENYCFPVLVPVVMNCEFRQALSSSLLFSPSAVDEHSLDAVMKNEEVDVDAYLMVRQGERREA